MLLRLLMNIALSGSRLDGAESRPQQKSLEPAAKTQTRHSHSIT